MRRTVIALALLLTAACARDTGPVAVPPEDIPFPLSRSVEPTVSGLGSSRIPVYFTRRGRLVLALRTVAPDPDSVMRVLLDGPNQREAARGIRSEIPDTARLLGVTIEGTVAFVDVSGEFQGPASSESIVLRVAQVVYSLARLPEIRSVRFLIDGEPVGVVVEDGSSVERPVSPDDYRSFAPPT